MRPTESAEARRRRDGRSLLSRPWLLLSLTAAGWLVWRSRDDLRLLAGVSVGLITAMVSMHVVSLLSQSERFRLILQDHSDSKLAVLSWMRLFTRGRLFSSLVPQSGNVYRGLVLRQDHGTPVVRYISSLATQTWLSVVVSLVFAIVLGWIALRSDPTLVAGPTLALAAMVPIVMSGPLLLARLSSMLPGRVQRTLVVEKAAEIVGLAVRTLRRPALVAVFLVYVLVGFVASATALQIAFAMAGQMIPWIAAATIVAFVHLGNLVAITPGNLGIQELGVAALAGVFGYALGAGVIASVVVRLSNIVGLAILVLCTEVGEALRSR